MAKNSSFKTSELEIAQEKLSRTTELGIEFCNPRFTASLELSMLLDEVAPIVKVVDKEVKKEDKKDEDQEVEVKAPDREMIMKWKQSSGWGTGDQMRPLTGVVGEKLGECKMPIETLSNEILAGVYTNGGLR
ncbi:hypothetical protein ACH5RR_018761 [Cinchona calisaya]|uniref:Uncharacterized protein n=1 Tax=Cinchona calisaya TaxID=153742 RepID=A0ABD2ZQ63_9GENT